MHFFEKFARGSSTLPGYPTDKIHRLTHVALAKRRNLKPANFVVGHTLPGSALQRPLNSEANLHVVPTTCGHFWLFLRLSLSLWMFALCGNWLSTHVTSSYATRQMQWKLCAIRIMNDKDVCFQNRAIISTIEASVYSGQADPTPSNYGTCYGRKLYETIDRYDLHSRWNWLLVAM